jgi:uncharacterized protein YlxW (UPF0749 family)
MNEGLGRLRNSLRPRPSRGQIGGALLLALLGFATAVQVRSNQGDNLDSLRQSDLVRILDDVSQRATRLQARAQELEDTRNKLSSGSDNSRAALDEALAREQTLGILAGTLPATGPGILFTVDDPNGDAGAAVLLDALEELRDAGAEAVELGSAGGAAPVRVVASTALVDPLDGRTGVLVDGTLLASPYRFLVIGDPRTLAAALDIPGGVLDSLSRKGATGTVSQRNSLTIETVRPLPQVQYAQPVPTPSGSASPGG